jgi:hypothetical protein
MEALARFDATIPSGAINTGVGEKRENGGGLSSTASYDDTGAKF